MNKLFSIHMFARNVGNSDGYFRELFSKVELEAKKLDEIPEKDKRERRAKRLLKDLVEAYGYGAEFLIPYDVKYSAECWNNLFREIEQEAKIK